jgi:hypothetical protein
MVIPCKVCESKDPPIDPIPASKYKCPKCFIPYCSVSCFKSHTCIKNLVSNPADYLPITQLSQISNRNILNQELLQIVKEIDDSPTSHEAVLKLKKFRSGNKEFDDWCLGVLESVKQPEHDDHDDAGEEVIDNSLYLIK